MTGYKRPPRSTQFQKGHSGNPKGRPKGSGNFKTDLLQVMGENVFITKNGQRRAVSGRKAVAIKLLHDALHGEPQSLSRPHCSSSEARFRCRHETRGRACFRK